MATWVQTQGDLLPELGQADAAASELREQLAAALSSGNAVIEINGRRWRAGAVLLRFLEDGLAAVDAGRKLGYVAEDELLSPAQAADLLGFSRPFVYQLMKRGELPVAQVRGTHRKVAARDVLAWQQAQSQRSAAAEAVASKAEAALEATGAPMSGRALARQALVAARAGDAAALDASLQDAAAARVADALRRQHEAVAEDVPVIKGRRKALSASKAMSNTSSAVTAAQRGSTGRVRAADGKSIPVRRSAAASAVGRVRGGSKATGAAVDTEVSAEL